MTGQEVAERVEAMKVDHARQVEKFVQRYGTCSGCRHTMAGCLYGPPCCSVCEHPLMSVREIRGV